MNTRLRSRLSQSSNDLELDETCSSSSDEEYIPSNGEESDEGRDSDEGRESFSRGTKRVRFADENPVKLKKQRFNYCLEDKIQDIVKIIKDNTPSINQIIELNIPRKRKAELVELFEVFEYTGEPTLERLEVKERLNNMILSYTEEEKFYDSITTGEREILSSRRTKLSKSNIEPPMEHRIMTSGAPEDVLCLLLKKNEKLSNMSQYNDERHKIKSYIEWAISLPYGKIEYPSYSIDYQFFANLKEELDRNLYGMEDVKTQILVYVNSRLRNTNLSGFSLALKGKPGTGKTSIVRLLSRILEIPFGQIFCGGATSASFIRGHEYTYIGAQPGVIVRELIKMQCSNGIIFLDEFDKACKDPFIVSSLLQVIDPTQNSDFRDDYFDRIKVDLSKVWFILSMNELPNDTALEDRMFVVDIPGYDRNDKIAIASNYLFPKAIEAENMAESIIINKKSVEYIVDKCPEEEEGVRSIKKMIEDIVRKIAFIKNNGRLSGELDIEIKFPLKLNVKILNKLI